MYLGYNTNGFAHHKLDDALTILAELGYAGVALTLDHHVLNPYSDHFPDERRRIGRQVESLHLRCVIETGARFLLDPRRKHQPTLVSTRPEERARRAGFLIAAIELAAQLRADAVSFWSGTPVDDLPAAIHQDRLAAALEPVLAAAERKGVRLALEPEPGMLIGTLAAARDFCARVDHLLLGLTVDIGHLHCQAEGDMATLLGQAGAALWNVHIEDMRKGVHDHLQLGTGEIDFGKVFEGLRQAGYEGGVFVELSRHSHDAVNAARQARTFLRPWL